MQYKYFAFISYNQRDTAWGKRLQRKLEHYRMPATLCSEHNWSSQTPIKPVFFAPTDIQPGGLSEELQQRLAASEHLIVICSPNSAQSEWVGKEIAFFHSLGRPENIHFFIVAGSPHSGDPRTECFNPILQQLNLPEILGANVHEPIYRWPWLNRERAYVQLITKLLGVEFDTLWNRHRRLLIRNCILAALLAVLVVATVLCAFLLSKPVDVRMSLREVTSQNTCLPPLRDARVSLVLPNESKDTTFTSLTEQMVFSNVPADLIGQEVQVHFSCPDYLPLDTTLTLTRSVCLDVSRDPEAYGHVRFTLYNQSVTPVPGKTVLLDGIPARSDAEGRVDVLIPIAQQRKVYRVTSTEVLLQDSLKDAKCGDSDAIFTR